MIYLVAILQLILIAICLDIRFKLGNKPSLIEKVIPYKIKVTKPSDDELAVMRGETEDSFLGEET